MKKIASILLSFMIIMIVLLVFPNVVKAEEIPIDAGTIYAGDTKTITVSNPGETYYYNYTPDESTLYVLWSEENTADPCGYLLDSEDNQIEYNDDGNGNQNFLIKKELEKDVHYKIKVKLYGDDKTGEFKIKLLKITSINDGAMSKGTVTKNVGNNERRYATFTPNETGTYNVTAVASKRFYFKFAGSSFTAERVHDSFHLEKDKEYKIEYYILDYTADSIDITINKCLPIQNGTLSINSDNVITNNNENQFYEYTFEITESNNYFLVGDYNDEVSKDFKVEILKPGNTDWDTYTGIGSYRLKQLETGTYSARIYLNGSATVKIIGQIAIDFGNLKLGDQKTVGFTGVAKRYTYTITPTESDVYRLFSDENEFDPCAYLYNSNGEEIKYSDDDGYGQNFSITYYLEEGKTYVLTVEAYD